MAAAVVPPEDEVSAEVGEAYELERAETVRRRIPGAAGFFVVSIAAAAVVDRLANPDRAREVMAIFAAQAVLSAAKEALRDGTLVERSDRFEARLERSGDRLVSQATRAAESNPLEGWKRRFPGIATRDFTFKGLKVNAVAIDLADPRVRLQTNSQSERGRTVDGHEKIARAHARRIRGCTRRHLDHGEPALGALQVDTEKRSPGERRTAHARSAQRHASSLASSEAGKSTDSG